MKCSDYIIDFLAEQKVTCIFEMIGGAIAHLLDSAHGRSDIRCVSLHHEQSAAFAAEGYARVGGNLGVAMATSGPGALNLLTGVGSCYFDSVPCLFITGQVNTYEYKFEQPVRQIGFQETDIVSVARPLVKHAEMITDAGTIRYRLEKAVYLARSGRPGPVLLDIPMNVQRAEIDPASQAGFYDGEEYAGLRSGVAALAENDLDGVLRAMKTAERPLILAGGGVRIANATAELESFVRLTGVPVVHSLMGLDALPGDDPASFGLIGSYGNRYSNLALANCDFVLVLGSRLDTRQTGTRPDTFARAAFKVHVDIDGNELNRKVQADIAISGGVKPFLAAMNDKLKEFRAPDLKEWYGTLERYRERYPTANPPESPDGIDPNRFMEMLSGLCEEGDLVCLDVGQHQMWASQSFRLKKGQRLLNAGGMGAMGFALPAAIGATLAGEGRRVVLIAGDGGFQVNIQELETIVRSGLPIKMFVLNNRTLGMVRQFQDMYFSGRRQSTSIGYGCPDFVKVAKAYGVPAASVGRWGEAEEAVRRTLSRPGCALLEVKLESGTVVNPKLAVGRPIEDMSPTLDRVELMREMVIDIVEEEEGSE